VVYDPRAVVTVPVKRGVVTLVVLDADEAITEVAAGLGGDCTKADAAWCVAAQPGGRNLFVKAKSSASVANNLPEQDPTLKVQCLLVNDEFTAMGHVGVITTAAAFLAGYNLRLLTVVQAMSQLDAVYGDKEARNWLANQPRGSQCMRSAMGYGFQGQGQLHDAFCNIQTVSRTIHLGPPIRGVDQRQLHFGT
jgi:hypothetical protein